MKFWFPGIFLSCLLFAVSLSAQVWNDNVLVLPMHYANPANARKLGTIRAGNNALKTHCDYEQTVNDLKKKAYEMGGNVVRITRYVAPAFIGKCYAVRADVFRESDAAYLASLKKGLAHAAKAPGYATLYIYRLKDTLTFMGSYDVHLNDSVICTVKSKSRDSVNIYQAGKVTLWGKAESRTSLDVDVQVGKQYYIRCGAVKGEFRMVPVMELVDPETGKREFAARGKSRKDMNAAYLKQLH